MHKDRDTAAAPTGRGVLGVLVADAVPLRVGDVTSHPESIGFRRGHPAMTTFLGVPVKVRDRVYGSLYVTEKT